MKVSAERTIRLAIRKLLAHVDPIVKNLKFVFQTFSYSSCLSCFTRDQCYLFFAHFRYLDRVDNLVKLRDKTHFNYLHGHIIR